MLDEQAQLRHQTVVRRAGSVESLLSQAPLDQGLGLK